MIEWTKAGKPANIRCPYCVDGSEFRIMQPLSDGDWVICSSCGHLAMLSSRDFECTCGKCYDLARRAKAHSVVTAPEGTLQTLLRRLMKKK